MIPLEGPFYDQLEVGQTLPVQPAITVDAAAAALYQSWFGERLALTLDEGLCEAVSGRRERLASPGLVAMISTGQSTTVSRHVIANLFYRDFRFLRPVRLGESLRTTVTVAALADSSARPDQPERGKALVDVETTAGGEPVLRYRRCPLLLSRAEGPLGHDDDVGTGAGSAELDLADYEAGADAVASWDLTAFGEPRPWAVGETVADPARESIDNAAAVVRFTHNLALAHRDPGASPYPARLVYGGHVVGLAQASLCRVVDVATVLGWHACDHLGPAFEGDLLWFRHTLLASRPTATGRLLAVGTEGFAERGTPDSAPSTKQGEPERILHWQVVVLAR